MDSFTQTLCAHLRGCGGLPDYEVDTLYLGGGTPSVLGRARLCRILEQAGQSLPLARDIEVTVECNPDSMSPQLLDGLRRAGANRLSIGVQSAHNDELTRLGRCHTWEQAAQAVGQARAQGFDNLSLDLMYGLPGQPGQRFLESVEALLALSPEHLSCYGLKLEPGTPLAQEKPDLPSEDEQADLYLALCGRLRKAGFEHYEISNWAKPGYRSKHNSKYWDLSAYLGLGPGAYSLFCGKRFFFPPDIHRYLENAVVEAEEPVEGFEAFGEFLMLSLRTIDGIAPKDFERRFQKDFTPYADRLRPFERTGLAQYEAGRWHLTEQGFLVSNTIIRQVLDAD